MLSRPLNGVWAWCAWLGQDKIFGSGFARNTYILVAINTLPSSRLLLSKNVKEENVLYLAIGWQLLVQGDARYSHPGMSLMRLKVVGHLPYRAQAGP